MLNRIGVLLLVILVRAAPARGADALCPELVPNPSAQKLAARTIAPKDLIQLRDIGPESPGDVSSAIFSISASGSSLAFQMRRADPVKNSICSGVFVLDLPTGKLRAVDEGGAIMPVRSRNGQFAAFIPSGLLPVGVPKFSPDGHWLAYLRRDNGSTQLWRAAVDGSGAFQVTHGNFDVESFAWLPDGHLVFSGRPDITTAEQSITDEGRQGYLFDDRWAPFGSDRPLPLEPVERHYFVIARSGDGAREATASEQQLLEHGENTRLPPGAIVGAATPEGAMAWSSAADPKDVNSKTQLNLKLPGVSNWRKCVGTPCDHLSGMWWGPDGRTIYFMNREGWAESRFALYRWGPQANRPDRLFETDEIFLGCQRSADYLICGREGAVTPRRLIAINLETRKTTVLFDPNPEFNMLRLGKVKRLHWVNSFGIPSFGDLVLPLGHRNGQHHPLVVVQYQTRGFLRGGTGDEFPIQLLAAHNIAVLSVEKPMNVGALRGGKTWEEISRLDREGWADRRSIESSIEAGIKTADALGLVDMTRLGITGLSDGASGTQFALVNTSLFKAAAIATCCEEPSVVEFLDGPAVGRRLNDVGYPALMSPNHHFWIGMSFHLNADRVHTPLLMQLADREYLGALEGFTALKESGRPVEMYVFPDEYHIKWQPSHRLASYVRSVDWFRFWLLGEEDPDPSKAGQYARWRLMRTADALSVRPSDAVPKN
jgi:dipeptidyl aminopeptidase/acylaminoacyl peptidase